MAFLQGLLVVCFIKQRLRKVNKLCYNLNSWLERAQLRWFPNSIILSGLKVQDESRFLQTCWQPYHHQSLQRRTVHGDLIQVSFTTAMSFRPRQLLAMMAVGHLSHRIFTTKWVGLFTYEPLIKVWTEDLVQINNQQSRVALHSPTRRNHNWRPKKHGSITSYNSRGTFITFLFLVSSKSLSTVALLLM